MFGFLESLRVRLMVGVTWRLSKERLLHSLRGFAATEADSAWQLSYAAERVSDPAQRAELFGQILEEMHHSAEFARLYKMHAKRPLIPASIERKALYREAKDMPRFFVYCQIGEAAAAQRFLNIHDALPGGPVKDVLRRILRDEAQHVHNAGELTKASGLEDKHVKTEMRLIKMRRAWEAWLRSGRQIADVVATVLLGVAYFAVGWICVGVARKRVFGGLIKPTSTSTSTSTLTKTKTAARRALRATEA